MSFLTLGLLCLHDVVRVPVGPATPVHLRDRPLLLKSVIIVATLIVGTFIMRHGVDSAVLASMRHLHLHLLSIYLALTATGYVLELLIVLLVVFTGTTLAFGRALGLLLLSE